MAFDVDERQLNLTLSTHHPTRYPLRLDQDSRTSRTCRQTTNATCSGELTFDNKQTYRYVCCHVRCSSP